MSTFDRTKRAGTGHGWTVAVVAVIVALVAASVIVAAVEMSASSAAAPSAGDGGDPGTSHGQALSVLSFDPADGSGGMAPDSTISLTFDSPLAPDSPLPSIVPAVAGSWARTASTLTFTPTASLPPGTTLSLSVPGGTSGVESSAHGHLPSSVTHQYTVAPMSTLRVQQLLAQLGYLPLSFAPADPSPLSPTELAVDQAGTFTWRWSTFPAALTSLWSPGAPNVVTKGAVMAFESDHNLGTDGVAGPQVWAALLSAVSAGQSDAYGHYDWVDVTSALPQHVTVWRDGSPVYSTPANTGIAAEPTAKGTFPVYVRYTSTTMSGTNPDGSHYSDPGIPWVSYFNGGDALHGFVRPGYGYPQSLGCVEMPPANAAAVYPLTPLGTLVTVE